MEVILIMKDRRRGPDALVKWVNAAGILIWALVLVILGFAQEAKPQVETVIDKAFNTKLRNTWNYSLINDALYLLIFQLILCVVTIFINSKRHRRKTDKYNPSVIILGIVSIIGIVLLKIKFY